MFGLHGEGGKSDRRLKNLVASGGDGARVIRVLVCAVIVGIRCLRRAEVGFVVVNAHSSSSQSQCVEKEIPGT